MIKEDFYFMIHENNEDSFDIEIELQDKKLKKKKKILSELKELNEDAEVNSSSLFLPSKLLEENKAKKEEKKSKKKGSLKSLTENANDWNDMITKMKFNNKSHVSDSYDGIDDMFTKKKKKKKKGQLTDFSKEFEPEIALYRNLLRDQSRFTEALQKEYDAMKSTKASSRGVNKNMTDLMENITDARTLAMQLIEKNVNTKKLIAELTMKEKKEFGSALDESNINEFAGSFLNKLIQERSQVTQNGYGYESDIFDINDESGYSEIDNIIEDQLGDNKRSKEVRLNLENEKKVNEGRNFEIRAYVDPSDHDNWILVPVDKDTDEPLPVNTYNIPYSGGGLAFNFSTGIARNSYKNEFPIYEDSKWEENWSERKQIERKYWDPMYVDDD
jgi:hypothetical protein